MTDEERKAWATFAELAALRAEVADAWSLAYNLDPDRTEPSELDLCGQINHLGEHLAALRARNAVLEKDLRISQAGIDRSVLDALTSKGCPRCSTIKEAKEVD